MKRTDYIEAKNSDGVQRFYCHYPRNKLLPGQEKVFTFSFRSTNLGIFNEEWELLTEPALLTPLPVLSMSGIAIEDETDLAELAALDAELETQDNNHMYEEILEDIVDAVKSPTPPLPNMEDPEVFKENFEANNSKYGLWYTPHVMNSFKRLRDEVSHKIGEKGELPFWDGSVDEIYEQVM